MSVSSTVARDSYIGNGSTSTFSWTFFVQNTSELEVVRATYVVDDDLVTKIWTEETLTLGYDYTAERNEVSGTGSITLKAGALGTNFRLAIRRKMPITQEADFKNNTTFDPRAHENALDRASYIAQQIQDDVNRSIKLHITDSDGTFDTTLPPGAKDNPTAVIVVNESGNGFEWGPTASDLGNAEDSAAEAVAASVAAAVSAAEAEASRIAAQDAAASAAADAAAVADIEDRLVYYIRGPYTANVTLDAVGQIALCDTSGGGFTVTLPPAIQMNDTRLVIKKSTGDAGVVTIDADGTDTVDGEASTALEFGYGYIVLLGDGDSKYRVIG